MHRTEDFTLQALYECVVYIDGIEFALDRAAENVAGWPVFATRVDRRSDRQNQVGASIAAEQRNDFRGCPQRREDDILEQDLNPDLAFVSFTSDSYRPVPDRCDLPDMVASTRSVDQRAVRGES